MKEQHHDELFSTLVQSLVDRLGKEALSDLRKDFHTRLRISLNYPDNNQVVGLLWDFFYDWCLFENPKELSSLFTEKDKKLWDELIEKSSRGLYSIVKVSDKGIKLKELYTGDTYFVSSSSENDFLGLAKGDLLESRLLKKEDENATFVRTPAYHPLPVHSYIKKKVKKFKKSEDKDTYNHWLWLLVGMHLKHKIYQFMPVEKIYDDNARI